MIARIVFRLLTTVIAASIMFCVVLVLTAIVVAPHQESPNSGFVLTPVSLFGLISIPAWACSAVVIALGVAWTMKALPDSNR